MGERTDKQRIGVLESEVKVVQDEVDHQRESVRRTDSSLGSLRDRIDTYGRGLAWQRDYNSSERTAHKVLEALKARVEELEKPRPWKWWWK